MIGQTVSHHRILKKLGEGGMGVVYKAHDAKLNRTVALKFLPQNLTRDQEAIARFINEAQAASSLDHANICTIYEINETAEGQLYIAMACYEGETLEKQVASKQLSVSSAIDIAIQIARGLERAHEAGIIHRDIKPSNLIITTRGEVKIIDFGLAKLAGQMHFTKTGNLSGTVAYMSPEQVQGQAIDHRTDIWSLGVVLYEMLTGEAPFKGADDQVVIYSIVNEDPPTLTALQPEAPATLTRSSTRRCKRILPAVTKQWPN
jgi:serine/threonine-protein kinase